VSWGEVLVLLLLLLLLLWRTEYTHLGINEFNNLD
jgi:hypothetical protein